MCISELTALYDSSTSDTGRIFNGAIRLCIDTLRLDLSDRRYPVDAAPAPAEPFAGKFVPLEPTEEMTYAARHALRGDRAGNIAAPIYRAMLAAAPTAAAPVQPLSDEPWLATHLWNRRETWACPADVVKTLAEFGCHPPEASPLKEPKT